ncbi:MAG TPA: SAM-dependent methyltransferase [Clostridiaceae bacterium]|nr:SAM-dependent methyltransferase [Clostridiaceae bacterium]
MQLKGRLKLVADMVPPCRIVGDVGTDHAYVPIYLVKNKICEKAIATDVRTGPIDKARKNIMQYKMESYIETRVGYGLEPLEDNEIDIVIIAGMGGLLIRDIISKSYMKAQKARRLIFQPMNAADVLREWLYKNGFDISDEGIAQEDGKIYIVLAAEWTGLSKQFDEVYYHVGEKLVGKRDPLLKEYLERKLRQIDKTVKGLNMAEKKDLAVISNKIRLKEDIEKILKSL